MDTLVGIANQYPEGEFLPLIIEVFPRLMALDQAFTAASAPKFLPFLRDVFAAKAKGYENGYVYRRSGLVHKNVQCRNRLLLSTRLC